MILLRKFYYNCQINQGKRKVTRATFYYNLSRDIVAMTCVVARITTGACNLSHDKV